MKSFFRRINVCPEPFSPCFHPYFRLFSRIGTKIGTKHGRMHGSGVFIRYKFNSRGPIFWTKIRPLRVPLSVTFPAERRSTPEFTRPCQTSPTTDHPPKGATNSRPPRFAAVARLLALAIVSPQAAKIRGPARAPHAAFFFAVRLALSAGCGGSPGGEPCSTLRGVVSRLRLGQGGSAPTA